jgi:hypothetical protein
MARSRAVPDTRTSPVSASPQTRAASCTPMPPMLSPIRSHSPQWMPLRTSTPRNRAASRISAAQRIARAGPSNVARKPFECHRYAPPGWPRWAVDRTVRFRACRTVSSGRTSRTTRISERPYPRTDRGERSSRAHRPCRPRPFPRPGTRSGADRSSRTGSRVACRAEGPPPYLDDAVPPLDDPRFSGRCRYPPADAGPALRESALSVRPTARVEDLGESKSGTCFGFPCHRRNSNSGW